MGTHFTSSNTVSDLTGPRFEPQFKHQQILKVLLRYEESHTRANYKSREDPFHDLNTNVKAHHKMKRKAKIIQILSTKFSSMVTHDFNSSGNSMSRIHCDNKRKNMSQRKCFNSKEMRFHTLKMVEISKAMVKDRSNGLKRRLRQ